MNIITTKEQLAELVEFYSKVDAFAWDTETNSPDDNALQPVTNTVLWVSMATEGRSDAIPIGHPVGEFIRWDKPLTGAGQKRLESGKELREVDYSARASSWTPIFDEAPEQLLPGEVFAALKPLLFSDKLKIAHNAKFDLKSVAKYYRGKVPSKPHFDTLMASFIVDNRNKNNLSLKDMCKRELGLEVEKGVGENIKGNAFSVVGLYAGLDAEATWLLYKSLAPKLSGSLSSVWQLEMDCLAALCDMELSGVTLDVEGMTVLQKQLEIDVDLARAKAYKAAGKVFPMNSVKEKQLLLYSPKPEGRGLKPNKKIKIALTPKGQDILFGAPEQLDIQHFAVSAEALEFFRGKDEVVDAILEYQDLNKLLTTYITPYLGGDVTRNTGGKVKVVEKKSLLINGKAHTNFKAHGAETGRFSCVSGDTLLPTNRGYFRFDEYTPLVGDLVMTHAGRWMPVLQKIYKGIDDMYSVTLDNGSVLHCTMSHKLLTSSGWISLGELTAGDEVISYQQPIQLGSSDEVRAQQTPLGVARIKEISFMGPMGVWDISVAGDESYLAHGFVNHNSSEPNLQNIPASGKYGKLIRGLFIAPPGYKIVGADYSQIEPRLIASFSGDPIMMKNYLEGGDIYTTVGDIMGVDRKAGKTLVLAMSYGVGPDKIASSIGCSVTEAKALLTNFSSRFPDVAKYKAKVIRQASQKDPMPYVETIFGRRRYLPSLRSKEVGLRSSGERQAFNTVVQGSAADLMKLAIVRAHSCFIDEPEANVILTVHDELVTVCREDLAEDVAEAIRVSMEGIHLREIKVPLTAEVGIGDSWGDAKG